MTYSSYSHFSVALPRSSFQLRADLATIAIGASTCQGTDALGATARALASCIIIGIRSEVRADS
jgi:hypothetical protein